MERFDVHRIQSDRPDIMILMIGDNAGGFFCGFFFDTDCEGLAGRLVSITTINMLLLEAMYQFYKRSFITFTLPFLRLYLALHSELLPCSSLTV